MLSGRLLSYSKKRRISRNVHSCHSLSFIVTRCQPLYQSLYHLLSLVVTRCTTRLPFYIRSVEKFKHVQTFQLIEINFPFFEDAKFSVITLYNLLISRNRIQIMDDSVMPALEISQNSQENTCARASILIKLQA